MQSDELGSLPSKTHSSSIAQLHRLGVNIIVWPTLLSFAQLQNFFVWTAFQSDMPVYFCGHMDVVALSFEDHYAQAHPEVLKKTTVNLDATYEGYESI